MSNDYPLLPANTNMQDGFSYTDFRIPSAFAFTGVLKFFLLVLVRTDANLRENCKCVYVLVLSQFSSILILLLNHRRKFEGVRKFVLEYPS
jgi:hypothetical protein